MTHNFQFLREKSHYGKIKNSKNYLSQALKNNQSYLDFKDTYSNYTRKKKLNSKPTHERR